MLRFGSVYVVLPSASIVSTRTPSLSRRRGTPRQRPHGSLARSGQSLPFPTEFRENSISLIGEVCYVGSNTNLPSFALELNWLP